MPIFGEVAEWFVVKKPTTDTDELNREVWTTSQEPVTLKQHQADVAERAKTLCEKVNLAAKYTAHVVLAAAHHDGGKADRRFQNMLGRTANEPELAKSRDRTPQQAMMAKHRSALPQGWRHEQMSALMLSQMIRSGAIQHDDAEVAIRIVGCSHGLGRSTFTSNQEDFLASDTAPELAAEAARLFTEGAWDDLVWRTDKEFGPYQMAYLECLERAADAQISGEGR